MLRWRLRGRRSLLIIQVAATSSASFLFPRSLIPSKSIPGRHIVPNSARLVDDHLRTVEVTVQPECRLLLLHRHCAQHLHSGGEVAVPVDVVARRDGQSRIESREGRRVAAACCATADTVPFRLFEALLRSVCVVFIEGAEYRIDLGFGLQLP